MDDRVVVQLALVTDRGEQKALQEGRLLQQHQRLVRVARENHVVEGLSGAGLVLDDHFRRAPVDLAHRAVEMDLVPEARRQRFVDAPGAPVPGLHRSRRLDIEKLQVAGEQRRRHVEHVRCHQEVDEHGLENLVSEIAREPAQVENGAHADVVERVEGTEQPGSRAVEPTEPLQAFEPALEFLDVRLQLAPDVGVEIVRVDAAAVAHAVAEPGIEQLDTVLLHEQENVMVDRGDAGGDGRYRTGSNCRPPAACLR